MMTRPGQTLNLSREHGTARYRTVVPKYLFPFHFFFKLCQIYPHYFCTVGIHSHNHKMLPLSQLVENETTEVRYGTYTIVLVERNIVMGVMKLKKYGLKYF